MAMNAENMVVVYISQGPLSAEVVRAKLESAGIPVLLRYEAIGRVLGLTVDGLGRVEVTVPLEREEEARDLLSEIEEGGADPSGEDTGGADTGGEDTSGADTGSDE
jgi:hypothetical protein